MLYFIKDTQIHNDSPNANSSNPLRIKIDDEISSAVIAFTDEEVGNYLLKYMSFPSNFILCKKENLVNLEFYGEDNLLIFGNKEIIDTAYSDKNNFNWLSLLREWPNE